MLKDILEMFKNNENSVNNNEDSQNKKIVINEHRCPENHACPSVKVCPVNALSQRGHKAPDVDMDTCIKCGKCVRFCPMRAIALE